MKININLREFEFYKVKLIKTIYEDNIILWNFDWLLNTNCGRDL